MRRRNFGKQVLHVYRTVDLVPLLLLAGSPEGLLSLLAETVQQVWESSETVCASITPQLLALMDDKCPDWKKLTAHADPYQLNEKSNSPRYSDTWLKISIDGLLKPDNGDEFRKVQRNQVETKMVLKSPR